MSKKRKVILGSVLLSLALMAFHPVGLKIVMYILPMGAGILDLIGTGCFILFIIIMIYPSKKPNKLRMSVLKEKKQMEDVTDSYQILYEIMLLDKDEICSKSFLSVVDCGKKHNIMTLVDRFMDYYGRFAIKLLGMKDDLYKHREVDGIGGTLSNIDNALLDMRVYCKKFIEKSVSADILDIESDISVLGTVSELRGMSKE